MKQFAKNYLKAFVLVLVSVLILSAFVGFILFPVWIRDIFGVGYGLAMFGVYVLLFIGLIAGTMDDKN